MNCRKGTRRAVWLLSIAAGVLFATYGLWQYDAARAQWVRIVGPVSNNQVFHFCVTVPLMSLLSFTPGFVGTWLAYLLVCWVVRGFLDENPKPARDCAVKRRRGGADVAKMFIWGLIWLGGACSYWYFIIGNPLVRDGNENVAAWVTKKIGLGAILLVLFLVPGITLLRDGLRRMFGVRVAQG